MGRELVLVKVNADSKTRGEITQICDVFRGKIIDVSPSSLIIEVTGNENKIKAFLSLLESFGVTELPELELFPFVVDRWKIKFNYNTNN